MPRRRSDLRRLRAARERRAFLASRFAARGGPATLTAGGLGLPKKASAATRHHHLPANADTVHWGFFSKNLMPQLEVKPGDVGLAPKEADDVNSVRPSYTGGNIDNWRIGRKDIFPA